MEINRVQKTGKRTEKRQKRTHMSGAELKRLRREMKYRPCDMWLTLGLPRRTYQDYEAGLRGIPQEVAAAVREAHRRDREFVANLPTRIGAILDRDFPDGIR
jgi:hypothetical protein